MAISCQLVLRVESQELVRMVNHRITRAIGILIPNFFIPKPTLSTLSGLSEHAWWTENQGERKNNMESGAISLVLFMALAGRIEVMVT